MQFQVPQFIEIEDKVFGPFTFKQFIYLAGAAGGSFLFWKILPHFIGLFFIVPIAGLGLALAFYKPNGRPFVNMLESAFYYSFKNKLYLWNKEEKKRLAEPLVQKKVVPLSIIPKLTENKLREISWSLDIKEKIK